MHSPIGGQGLNLGLQDAANLGWKLALVVNGQAPDSLLDTYTAERHPVGSRVLRNSRAESALLRTDPQTEALRELVGEILQTPQAVRHLAEEINGMHVRYSAGSGHRLDGTFAPDLELDGLDNPLPSNGHGLLLCLTDSPPLRRVADGWSQRIDVVTTASHQLALATVLIRPDGYIATALDHSTDVDRLHAAMTQWFGPRTST